MPNNDMLDALSRSAQAFVEVLDEHLTLGYPEAIKKSVVIDPPQADSNGFSIDVKVGGKEAPMAAAFEYGSGLHRTRGEPPEKYRIPDLGGGDYVAFPSERWPQYQPPPNAPSVFKFPFVMHPGIVQRPFVVPSIEASKDEIRKILGQGFRAMIMTGIPPVIVIEVK